ncbi:ROK family transcriptional regulator [Paenibacillus nasutitermitis]|uniref:Transcriptional regulator n=1 Tax=Paenibacillus nasutitermitis TaxID=1652958 RepID=A0A917DWT5_9BACL|nr:ROK family transcriptional regulator [Paenibacillus nasutitermitis]GGD77895.1 transcriptional regulator [Paenibacillus nasutitermitis]
MRKLTLQHSDLSKVNRATVLNLIRMNNQISRADIVKKTKLAGPSVSRIVQDLINEGLVGEKGVGESIGGRKPILLTFRPDGRMVMGMDIRPHLIHGIICNLDGDVVCEGDYPIHARMSPQEVIDSIIEHAEALLRKSKTARRDLAGIGLSIPGLVDHQTFKVRFSPPTGWRNLSLQQPLSDHFGVPVMVDNTVEVMTLAEKYMGSEASQMTNNLVFLYFGAGVGAGVINNGLLFRGSRYSGMEVGHTTIDLHGPQCRCGNYGCLEAMTSERAFLGKVNVHLANLNIDPVQTIAEVAALIEERKVDLQPVFQEMSVYLGVGIANMINLFNPDVIVLGGWPSELGQYVMDQAKQVGLSRSLEGMSEGVELLASSIGERSVILGAASLIIQMFFTGELASIVRERV